jgi:hypothetical protein
MAGLRPKRWVPGFLVRLTVFPLAVYLAFYWGGRMHERYMRENSEAGG